MPTDTWHPPFDRFFDTAEAVAKARPDVDLDLAHEVFDEVATLLYNGLVLDGLDDHDAAAVVDGLCVDLVSEDPAAAVRERARTTLGNPEGLHDPEGVSRTSWSPGDPEAVELYPASVRRDSSTQKPFALASRAVG